MYVKRFIFCIILSVMLTATFIPTIAFGAVEYGDSNPEWAIEDYEDEVSLDAKGEAYLVFTVDVDGCEDDPELLYQWYDEDGALEGIIGDNYTATRAGNYYCQVTDKDGCSVNVWFTVVPNQNGEPQWTVGPKDYEDTAYISKDNPEAELTVVADFSAYGEGEEPTLTYQWYGEDGEEIEGETEATFTATHTGNYWCQVADTEGNEATVDFYVYAEMAWTAEAYEGEAYLSKDNPTAELEVITDVEDCIENPDLTYQWYDEDGAIDSAIGSTYTAAKIGQYYCTVTDKYNNYEDVWFYVYYQKDWTVGPKDDEEYMYISKTSPEAELTVVADVSAYDEGEEPTLSYQWYEYDEGGKKLEGEIDQTYTATKKGQYYCTVTDKDDNYEDVWFYVYYQKDWTAEADEYNIYLSKANPEAVLKVITDTSECDDEPVLSFQWYDKDGEIDGATGTTYTTSKEGEHYCIVSDEDGNSTNVWFSVYYETEWSIEYDESDAYISKTKPSAELKVIADITGCGEDPGLTYQWYDNDSEIDGATNATYTATKAGSYWCEVTDSEGHSKSISFYVSYHVDWKISVEESEITISKANPSAELKVIADITGCDEDPGLTYQWYYGDDGDDVDAIAGETSSTYTTTQSGSYCCIVKDSDGHSNMREFWVYYQTEWRVYDDDSDESISKTKPSTELKVTADTSKCTEDPELRYQWYDSDDEAIEGATGATYTATEEGDYKCVATDNDGYSRTVWYTVYYQTEWRVTNDSYSYAYITKSKPSAELEVTVDTSKCTEDPELSYQWYNGNDRKIQDATSAAYTATKVGSYFCEVSDNEGHSKTIEFYVEYQTDWSAEADEYRVYISKKNPSAELKVITDTTACETDPGLSFKWYDSDDKRINDATGTSCTVGQEGHYECVVKDNEGNSKAIEFWVGFDTEWTVKSDDYETFISKSNPSVELKFTVDTSECTEEPELNYQWYHGDGEGSRIKDATSETYTASETGEYECVVTDNEGHSNAVWFYVSYRTDWSVDADDYSVYISKSNPTAELKVIADTTACEDDPELSYKWYDDDGDRIIDATGATYTATKEGEYRCVVTDNDGYSNTIWFSVYYQTDWDLEDDDVDCYISKSNPSVELKVTADTSACTEDPELRYQWYDDDGKIAGATGTTYTAAKEGNYRCDVTDNEGYSKSRWFYVEYQTEWSVAANESEVFISSTNPSVELKVTADTSECTVDPGLSYQWYKCDEEYDDEIIDGATSATYTATEVGRYMCKVTDNEGHYNTVSFRVKQGFSDLTDEIIATAEEINTGDTKTVNTEEKDGLFAFTPTTSGMYVFYSECGTDENADPVGRVLDASGEEIATDDDFNNSDFQIIFKATAGETYYLQARNYSSSNAVFTVVLLDSSIESISYAPSEEALIAERSCNRNDAYWIESSRRIGDKLTLHHPDGTKTVYVYKEVKDEDDTYHRYVNEADDNDVLPGSPDVIIDYTYDSAIAAGSTRTIPAKVNYAGLMSDEFTTSVKFAQWHGSGLKKIDATEATCESAGNSAYWKCSRCGQFFADADATEVIAENSWVIPKYQHQLTKHEKVEATCTKAGNVAYWGCDGCHKYYSDENGENAIEEGSWVIPKLSHNMTKHDAANATCTEIGNSTYWSCDKCHQYFSDENGEHSITENSWVIPKLGHNMTKHDAVKATCTKAGNSEYYYCDRCKKYFSDKDGDNAITENSWVIPAGHTEEVIPAVAATCTEKGLTEGKKCSVCGTILKEQEEVPANGHNFGEWETKTSACSGDTEWQVRVCSVCGQEETSGTVGSGHDWEDTYKTDKEPTCTDDGSESIHCKKCDAKKDSRAISKLGHEYVAVVTDPTCTEQGYTTHTCSRCTDQYVDTYVPAHGHDLTKTEKVEPTIKAEGTEAYWTCGTCGKMFSDAGGKTEIKAPVKIDKLPNPAKQMGSDGTALGKGASAVAAEKAITTMKDDNDPAGSAFSTMKLRSTKQAKTSITLSWNKAKGAVKYVIYGNKCGKSNKMKKISTATTNKFVVKKAAGKKLVKGKSYKFIVVALDKSNNVVTTSKVIHVVTSGTKAGNYKSVTVTKKVINAAAKLKKGKTLKLGAKLVPVAKKKVTSHCKLRYESTNKKIATVSAKGVVKGVKKGTCYVNAYAQNGVFKTIKVVVK